MITIFLRDGLGNQMFQYAFARALQMHTKKKLSIALNFFENDKAGRMYGLNNFCIDKNIEILSSKKSRYALLKYKIMNKISVLLGREESKRYFGKHIVCAYSSDVYGFEDYKSKKFAKKIFVSGQFQNYKYFEEYADSIKKELRVKTKPSEDNQEMISEINNKNSVCVHVRRGDYLDSRWKHLNVCDYKYYISAMKYVCEKIENPIFYIFSNTSSDINWIKENYDFSAFSIRYVDMDNDDYEEIRLMYTCKHFIISNSTFSWWAQYLGEYEDKIVVAPSRWNMQNIDCSGIYMNEWILM